MKKSLSILTLSLLCAAAPAATVTVGSWTPIFQGVDLAKGRQQEAISTEIEQQVLCLRVDLTDPDITLLTTPKCTNCSPYEVLAANTGYFLEQNGLQVAINGGNYASSSGPNDVPLGTLEDVYGLAISEGVQVSPNMNGYLSALLFTTNNEAIFTTNASTVGTTGIFTAIAGNRPLLLNGVNLQAATPNDLDPRTAIGLSADRRYLFLMTIDGRQGTREGVNPPWSDGADFHDTGEWLKRFGASDGINVDGGGSTTMDLADCVGKSVTLNQSSFVYVYGRERIIGHNVGVHAKPLPSDLKNLDVDPGNTTANLTWQTEVAATTQVEYGLTTSYGSATPLDTRLVKHHVATLAGLAQGANYYFRAISAAGGLQFTQACQFTTLTSQITTQMFGFSQIWTYTTNNLDGVNWKSASYHDGGWLGQGPALLYVENSTCVQPKTTRLPPTYGQTIPRTYYFRTHFAFSGSTAGVSLVFSNYVDDGAVFYLNGAEIYRLRLPAAPTAIVNATAAINRPCAGTAQAGDACSTCPDVFTISGSALNNLVPGDNVLAVEVHSYGSLNSGDVVFGTVLIMTSPWVSEPYLRYQYEENVATLYWNGEGFTLQQAPTLAASPLWSDIPGPVTQSPYAVTNPASLFYRLKN